jgi:hypothetical protein
MLIYAIIFYADFFNNPVFLLDRQHALIFHNFYMLHRYLATCYNFDENPTHTYQHVIMCEINTRCDRSLPNRKKLTPAQAEVF